MPRPYKKDLYALRRSPFRGPLFVCQSISVDTYKYLSFYFTQKKLTFPEDYGIL